MEIIYVYSFHCYNWFLDGTDGIDGINSLYRVGKEMVGDKPLWCTEIGYHEDTLPDVLQLRFWISELNDLGCPFVSFLNSTVALKTLYQ